MLVSISNTVLQNWIFISIFVIFILASFRFRKDTGFSISVTNELKGLAILAVVLSHIGLFLVIDTNFLFPLTILAGVGVNLFLFLSGFGLTISSLKREETIKQFYKRKLLKLLVPFWIVLFVLFLMDYLILGITYSKIVVLQSIFGIFTQADLYQDINSPLWFITWILLFYILYPLFFSKKRPWLSALALYVIAYFFTNLDLIFFENINKMHQLHLIAFPLGVFVAWLFNEPKIKASLLIQKVKEFYKKFKKVFYPVIIILCLSAIYYLAIHSGVGESINIEQRISILTMLVIILFFLVKKFEFGLFGVFGVYSYEIYLFHWPIMYRYDIFYKYMPAWMATVLYLGFFIFLGWILKIFSRKVLD